MIGEWHCCLTTPQQCPTSTNKEVQCPPLFAYRHKVDILGRNRSDHPSNHMYSQEKECPGGLAELHESSSMDRSCFPWFAKEFSTKGVLILWTFLQPAIAKAFHIYFSIPRPHSIGRRHFSVSVVQARHTQIFCLIWKVLSRVVIALNVRVMLIAPEWPQIYWQTIAQYLKL